MPKAVTYGKTERMSFARHEEIQSMPNLLEIQKNSYKWFLEEGLRDVFKDVDVITDYSGNLELRFVDYAMDEKPKYTEEECKARDATYAAPLKVSVRLRNKETEEIKEQEIFMGDFPIMTPSGTFVINGAERVIVSQIVRSPGVYYDKKTDKAYNSTYGTTVIPYHGAWLEYETDLNDIFNCRIDKNRKLPVTWFIKAMGAYKADNPNTWLSCIPDMTTGVVTNEQIKEVFDNDARIVATLDKDTCNSREEALVEIYRKLRPGDPPTVESSESLLEGLFYDRRRYDISNVGRYKFNKKLGLRSRIAGHMLAAPVVDPMTGEIIAEAGEVLTRERAEEIAEAGVNDVYLDVDGKSIRVFGNGMVDMKHYVDFDPAELGIKELVRGIILRQLMEQYEGDALKEAIEENIDLLIPKHIIADDMFASVNYLCCLAHGIGEPDDIDHLGNRRVRSVGELLQNQFRIGFSRMERVIRERMTLQDLDVVTPQSLINIRPVTASIKEFFGSSPLSQFMDQTNPLAELTHKRRISALGPGGLSRERASFDVRDVHYSHYGRMCPIETPEGPNIGLISYLASYARVNEYGFLVTPFRRVEKGTCRVTDDVEYMTADVEDRYIVAQASEPVDENGCLINDRITCRHRDEIVEDGLHRDGHDPVPGKRRREPCPHGCEHAASGRAADGHAGADRRYRHRAQAVRGLRCGRSRRGRRRCAGRVGRQRQGALRQRRDQGLQAHQVCPLQPGHVHQPAPDRRRRRPPERGRRHCRRPGHLAGRDRARQEPAGRLHDLGRLQLRGRRSHQRASGHGGRLHLHSY